MNTEFPCWLINYDFGIDATTEKDFKKTSFPDYGMEVAKRVYLKFEDNLTKDGFSSVSMQPMADATRFKTKAEAESRLLLLCAESPDMIGAVGIIEWDGK